MRFCVLPGRGFSSSGVAQGHESQPGEPIPNVLRQGAYATISIKARRAPTPWSGARSAAEEGNVPCWTYIMVRNIDTVDERNNVRHAALLMFRRKRSCLPVTRDGNLRGIVTDSDFLEVAIALMEQMETVEPEAGDLDPLDS
ncbi:MAG: CBS domain-containing protein [Thioalkalivibrio sp.]|nr:CBS domain-containing protein [Thioalkalivibrio sp.]